jgi:hypothetical protein
MEVSVGWNMSKDYENMIRDGASKVAREVRRGMVLKQRLTLPQQVIAILCLPRANVGVRRRIYTTCRCHLLPSRTQASTARGPLLESADRGT